MFGWIIFVGAVAALAGYMAIATLAAHRLTQPRRRKPLSKPVVGGLTFEDVWFRARGEALTIAAWHVPAAGATQAVIIAHGIGGCRGKEFTIGSLPLVEHLVQRGFTVLMLDLRGHGQSDAARMTYGIHERRDLLGAVDWLLAQGYTPGAIGVLGASMGGVAGIGAAGEDPAIGALVIDSACADFPAMMRAHFRGFTRLPSFFLPATLLMARLLIGADLARLHPATLLHAITRRPVLVIHARGDQLVPVDHAQALAQAGDGQLWLTGSTRHLGSFGADPQVYSERISAFFRRSLAGQITRMVADLRRTYAQASVLPVRSGLYMRWYKTSEGLRLRWETLPEPVADDEDQNVVFALEGSYSDDISR